MNTQSKKPGAFAVDSLFDDVGATPKRHRPNGTSSAAKPSTLSSSPARYDTTPARSNATAGPSRLNNSSPAGTNGSPATPKVQFHQRPDKLKVVEQLHPHLPRPAPSQQAGTIQRVALSATVDAKTYNFRIAYERPMARSEALDASIDEAAEILREYYSIQEIGDPGAQSQDDIIVVGRLCSESDHVKMTETTTWLESSRMLGSGSRVLVKFDSDLKVRGGTPGAGGIGLFPGCLVGLRGRNGGGKMFSAKEIFMLPAIDASYTAPSEILNGQYGEGARKLGGEPMSVITAAGPYTVDSDLDFAPFSALLDTVVAEKPDALILMGPFIDADHPMIKAGNVDELPEDLFRRKISRRLNQVSEQSPRTNIILVPSGRDLVSTHVAYPQAPLDRESLQLSKGIRLLANPGRINVNEVVFAMTSVDIPMTIRNQEFFKKCPDAANIGDTSPEDLMAAKDVMARTCQHLLRQKSFYPVFPAPLPTRATPSVNLDITHTELIKMGTNGADVLILPSILKHFVRLVDSTVVVNPSYLTRGDAAGTFSRFVIHPLDRAELQRGVADGDDLIEHRVYERCGVDIVRI